MKKTQLMAIALEEAKKAQEQGEVPVGAIGIYQGQVITQSHNSVIQLQQPTAHAEMLVLKEAGQILENYRLNNLEIYCTLEPCLMCYTAMVHARITKLYYGASDPKTGFFSTGAYDKIKDIFNHSFPFEGGILQEECSTILSSFFKSRRDAGAVERGGLENR